MKRILLLSSVAAVALAMVSCTQPGRTEGKAAASVAVTPALPANVTADCLAALRKMVGDVPMKVTHSEERNGSYIIDVKVQTAEKPWRCFHNGTKCTGTEYQGEG